MNNDDIPHLPTVRFSAGLGRFDLFKTHAVLLDGTLEFRPMRVFHAGRLRDGTTEVTLQDIKSGEHHLIYVPKAPRDKVTFFSRWRFISCTTTGCRFVMWNPSKIERDMNRRPSRAH